MPETLMFLPGASGNVQFWKPVSEKLHHPGARRFVAWPGFGGVPADAGVRGLDDLVARVVRDITGPVALLAQSMGGVIAVRVALEKPSLVATWCSRSPRGPSTWHRWAPRTGAPASGRAISECRGGSSTSGRTSLSGCARSPCPCSSCGAMRTRSVPWGSRDGSRSCSLAPSWWSSPGERTTSSWSAPTEVAPHIERYLAT